MQASSNYSSFIKDYIPSIIQYVEKKEPSLQKPNLEEKVEEVVGQISNTVKELLTFFRKEKDNPRYSIGFDKDIALMQYDKTLVLNKKIAKFIENILKEQFEMRVLFQKVRPKSFKVTIETERNNSYVFGEFYSTITSAVAPKEQSQTVDSPIASVASNGQIQTTYSYFIRDYIPTIEQFVRENMNPFNKLSLEKSVEIMVDRIENKIKEILLYLRNQIEDSTQSIMIRYLDGLWLDEKSAEIFKTILEKQFKLEVICQCQWRAEEHSLGNDICFVPSKQIDLYLIAKNDNPYAFGKYDFYGLYKDKEAKECTPETYNSAVTKMKILYDQTQKQDFKGIELVSNNGDVFKVHKSILKDLNYFKMIFSHNSKEKSDKTVYLDFDSKVIYNFKKFLYAQDFVFSESKELDVLSSLYDFGARYQYNALIQFCVLALDRYVTNNQISEENFELLFNLAFIHIPEKELRHFYFDAQEDCGIDELALLNSILFKCLDWVENNDEIGQAILLSLLNENNKNDILNFAKAFERKKIVKLLEPNDNDKIEL